VRAQLVRLDLGEAAAAPVTAVPGKAVPLRLMRKAACAIDDQRMDLRTLFARIGGFPAPLPEFRPECRGSGGAIVERARAQWCLRRGSGETAHLGGVPISGPATSAKPGHRAEMQADLIGDPPPSIAARAGSR